MIRQKEEKEDMFFDIIISDFQMPVVNGIETLQQIIKFNKDFQLDKKQILVICSANNGPEESEKYL